MERSRTALLLALSLLLALFAAFLYQRWRGALDDVARLVSELEAAQARAAGAEQALAALREELAALSAAHAALREALSRPSPSSPQEAADTAAAGEATVSVTPAVVRREPLVLRSLADADDVYARAFDALDLEALWLLAADLLALGEPGYEKLIELFGRLEADKERFRETQQLWSAEELVLGPLLHTVADRHDDILRFGLYLSSKERDTLPEPLAEVQGELTDELGALLLGFYAGDDPAIWNGYLELYKQQLERDVDDDSIHALAAIPTEDATNFLLELAVRPLEPRTLQAVVRALAWKRSDRVVPFLLDLRNGTSDAETRATIDAALRYLRR